MLKPKKKRVRLYHLDKENPTRKVWFDIPVSIANRTIDIPHECLIATGIMEYAKHHPDAYPHPIHKVYVIKSTVYLIDEQTPNGDPSHAVRYSLSNSGTTGETPNG